MIEAPIVPVRELIVFPRMMVPLFLSQPGSLEAVEAAQASRGGRIFVVAEKGPTESSGVENCREVGTLCSVIRSVRLADGRLKVLVQGEARARLVGSRAGEPPIGRLEFIEEKPLAGEERVEAEALARSVLESLDKVIHLGRQLTPDLLIGVENLPPEQLPDAVGGQVGFALDDAYKILETVPALERVRLVADLLRRESDILGVKAEIESQAKDEMTRSQREYYLREQIRAIRTELGEVDERGPDVVEFESKIKKAKLPTEARKEAEKQLKRLEQMHPDSAEAAIIKVYLDWIADLPWNLRTEDRIDLAEARKILDEDHYDLKKVKQRILEFLGVSKLKGDLRGPILCFVGPPGVGKTSLGRSIAKSLGRKFVRISLGGLKDEAEIRGHRRTYVGAMPGRIIQGLKQASVRNPVFMLDEIDKVGTDFRGDPASALLEVLDPEQNSTFSDHYLGVPFDLSEVLFIATANVLDPIPPALQDRMEVIEIPGYSEEDKIHIAKRFLIPRQLEANGISSGNLRIAEKGISELIHRYTREAGVRNLDREIASVCRKVALLVAEGKGRPHLVTATNLHKYLGPAHYEPFPDREHDEVGVATGLAWTPYGGDVLCIEAQFNPAKRGGLKLTGHLGEVMKESAHAAMSYVRTREDLGVSEDFFESHELHVHVPEGAIPKDGPSAGVTIAAALLSAVTRRPVRKSVAMTGEITLRGRVLPVGGIREKLLAARRAGVRRVILPKANVKDLAELSRNVRNALEIVPVEHMSEVVDEVLFDAPEPVPGRQPRRRPSAAPQRPRVRVR